MRNPKYENLEIYNLCPNYFFFFI